MLTNNHCFQSHSRGAHAIEVDISMTADGVAVLLHDDTLERTTNGTGVVHERPYAYVQSLNAAANFGDG